MLNDNECLILLIIFLQVDLCKHFGHRSGPQNVCPDLDPNRLTRIMFLKDLFRKINFEEKKVSLQTPKDA